LEPLAPQLAQSIREQPQPESQVRQVSRLVLKEMQQARQVAQRSVPQVSPPR